MLKRLFLLWSVCLLALWDASLLFPVRSLAGTGAIPQIMQQAIVGIPAVVSAPSSPTYVNSASDFSGDGNVSLAVTAGNHLVVVTGANDTTTTHTCSNDGTANTYAYDGAQAGAGSAAIVMRFAHVKTLAATATIAITCLGATPWVYAVQYSGGTGDLDTTSAGTNPSFAASASATSPLTPAAFTPTTAATILVDAYTGLTGGSAVLNQVDTNFTTRGTPCLDGSSCFVGSGGTRVVASSASYSDGWSGTLSNDQIAGVAAYK